MRNIHLSAPNVTYNFLKSKGKKTKKEEASSRAFCSSVYNIDLSLINVKFMISIPFLTVCCFYFFGVWLLCMIMVYL